MVGRSLVFTFVGAVLLSCNPQVPSSDNTKRVLARLIERTERQVAQDLKKGLPVRADGYAYAIDLTNTMRAAVQMDNRTLFDRAYRLIEAHFLRTNTNDERARHTVLWRYAPEHPPDASGVKETGALADALWRAYEEWEDPRYREQARTVLDAYLRHGSWGPDNRFRVKNYYNYRTRSLASNTWLLNQMPHTVRRIGCATEDSTLLRFADGMARFMRDGALKGGFFHELYDPGIPTVIENSDGYYSPNGILKLQSSLASARALRPFYPAAAEQLITLLDESDGTLYTHYYYNPKANTVRPLWTSFQSQYWISEQALFLNLATSLQGVVGAEFVKEYVRTTVIPSLRTWMAYVDVLDLTRNRRPSTFYYEITLMMKAAHKYLHPEPSAHHLARASCRTQSVK